MLVGFSHVESWAFEASCGIYTVVETTPCPRGLNPTSISAADPHIHRHIDHGTEAERRTGAESTPYGTVQHVRSNSAYPIRRARHLAGTQSAGTGSILFALSLSEGHTPSRSASRVSMASPCAGMPSPLPRRNREILSLCPMALAAAVARPSRFQAGRFRIALFEPAQRSTHVTPACSRVALGDPSYQSAQRLC